MHHTKPHLLPKTITSSIISYGTYLPEQVIKSDHLFDEIKSESYGFPTDWMSSKMGILERRMSPDGTQPSDLAIPASQKAIENWSDAKPDDIDMIIFCGIERDQSEPATAHTINEKLQLSARYVFDISNACMGLVEGIELATQFVASQTIRYALVTTGEVPTRLSRTFIQNIKNGSTRSEFEAGIGALSVGDAGGAFIIGASQLGETSGFQIFNKKVDSSHIDKCIYWKNDLGELEGHMNMGAILGRGLKIHRNMIQDTLSKLNWDGFDWVLSHQTGIRSFNGVRRLTNIPSDKMIKIYDKYANTTTATLPLLWEKLCNNGRVREGDRIGGVFAGSGLATCQFGLYY